MEIASQEMKYLLLSVLLILCLLLGSVYTYDKVYVDTPVIVRGNTKNCMLPYNMGKTIVCRVTNANLRSKVNYQGVSLRSLIKKFGKICAVDHKKIPLWSKVTINGVEYTAVDKMSRKSVRKHKARYKVESCVDIYRDIPTKQLRKHDMGIKKVVVGL